MKYSQGFYTLKDNPATSMFLDQPCIFHFTSLNFHVIPDRFLNSSPLEKLFPGLTPEKFRKFHIFPSRSSSPHRGTETGCRYGSWNSALLNL